jgi:enolase
MQSEAAIKNIKARKVYNSRGSPTIEIEISTTKATIRVEAPSGASTGEHEVVSYPQGGVEEAIMLVNDVIAPQLLTFNIKKQEIIDRTLHEIDGTNNFQRIGGNTAFALSLAISKIAASHKNLPFFQHISSDDSFALPHPLGNVLGGGKHAGSKAPDIQEFLVLPVVVTSFSEAIWANIKVHMRVFTLLEQADINFTGGKGDEGAWAPNLTNIEALNVVTQASEEVSNELGVDIRVGLDVASSSFWDEKKGYVYNGEGVQRNCGEQLDYILDLINTYNLVYVEDPLHENDFDGFAEITEKAGTCLICGDDLFTTNPERLRQGIQARAGNAIIIKPNQIGTLTETLETVTLANQAGYIPIASHRSGETCDTYLAHLAVGFRCPIVKLGVVGGERTAKINELMRIEERLGKTSKIADLPIEGM